MYGILLAKKKCLFIYSNDKRLCWSRINYRINQIFAPRLIVLEIGMGPETDLNLLINYFKGHVTGSEEPFDSFYIIARKR